MSLPQLISSPPNPSSPHERDWALLGPGLQGGPRSSHCSKSPRSPGWGATGWSSVNTLGAGRRPKEDPSGTFSQRGWGVLSAGVRPVSGPEERPGTGLLQPFEPRAALRHLPPSLLAILS